MGLDWRDVSGQVCIKLFILNEEFPDCFLVAFIAMASYTAYVFLPGHIVMLGHFVEYVLGSRTDT